MKQTAQHTSGPWLYTYSPYTAQDGREIPAFEIHAGEKVADTNENTSLEEQEANACLIAAAPEMLEALEIIAAGNTDPDRMVEIAAQAVAKAKGGAA